MNPKKMKTDSILAEINSITKVYRLDIWAVKWLHWERSWANNNNLTIITMTASWIGIHINGWQAKRLQSACMPRTSQLQSMSFAWFTSVITITIRRALRAYELKARKYYLLCNVWPMPLWHVCARHGKRAAETHTHTPHSRLIILAALLLLLLFAKQHTHITHTHSPCTIFSMEHCVHSAASPTFLYQHIFY